MSENDSPKINVTRGKRSDRTETSSRATASGSSLPGPIEVAAGLARQAQNLWWAGLGALSVAEEAGTQVFDALVEEGKSWEQARRERTQETAEQVEAITQEGTRAVEAVEARVRDEVRETLRRVGVPHRDDVDELRDRIEALSTKLDRLAAAIDERTDDA
jgi:poly(hydroxyalkanoate) granule-associated protein